QREDPSGRRSRHSLEPALQLSARGLEVALEATLEPRPRPARTWLVAQRRQFLPEIGANVGIALRGPAGARGTPTPARTLGPERLLPEIRTEPVEHDTRELTCGAAVLAGPHESQCPLE